MRDRDTGPGGTRPGAEPQEVDHEAWLADLADQIARDAAAADDVTSAHDGAPHDVAATLVGAVRDLTDDLTALSHALHADPEPAYEEHRAAQRVVDLVAAHGHEGQVGAYGLDTAVRVVAGTGRPRVAFLAEYDALPEIGHACGHNVICATAVGAFLGAAAALRAHDVSGSVELIGTPAEEGGGGKQRIADAGGFDAVDAGLMLHPSGVSATSQRWLGRRRVEAVYHGRAAHASLTPHLGRNALDAVVTAYQGMAQLRQHLPPGDRVHGIITDGGQRPNIVPARAATSFYLRSPTPAGLAALCRRAARVFRSAADATGTTVDLQWDPRPPYLPVRSNDTLASRFAVNMATCDVRVLPAGVVPQTLAGSTDMGNVSVLVPSIHPTLAIAPPTVIMHNPAFAECAVSELADAMCVDGAIGLGLTGLDVLCDSQVRRAAADEFDRAGGVIDIDALLGDVEG